MQLQNIGSPKIDYLSMSGLEEMAHIESMVAHVYCRCFCSRRKGGVFLLYRECNGKKTIKQGLHKEITLQHVIESQGQHERKEVEQSGQYEDIPTCI